MSTYLYLYLFTYIFIILAMKQVVEKVLFSNQKRNIHLKIYCVLYANWFSIWKQRNPTSNAWSLRTQLGTTTQKKIANMV